MNQSFNYWKKQHDNALLEQFNTDVSGQLWLKLKSIIRPEQIKEFTKEIILFSPLRLLQNNLKNCLQFYQKT